MTDKNKENQTSFDIFIINSIFPDAESLFATYIKPLEEIKHTALVVLDTNSLLVPYSVSKQSLSQIKETYKKLVKAEQLLVPGQVAREFVKNRTNKISELFQKLHREQTHTYNIQIGKYPLLESLSDYQETVRLEKEIDKLLKDYKKAISNVLDHIRSWTWNDPVSLLYAELFTKEVVFDLVLNEEELKKDLSRRQLHSIPPGYKDSSKDDSGIGDLLIWSTILEVGQSRKKDVIFVSNDKKSDWWYKIEKQPLYPRYELIDEFRRKSKGLSLHIIPFSRFLDLYGASESVVEEVREEENRLNLEVGLIGEFVNKWQVLEQVLISKYRALKPDSELYRWLPTFQIVDLLDKKGLIDRDLANRIHELKKIRNVLLHEGLTNMLTNLEIEFWIASMDDIIEILDQPPNEPG
jgi:hypothetical protein